MELQTTYSLANSFWLFLITAVIILFPFLYCYVWYKLNYWSRLGVSGPRPLPFIGTMYQLFWHPLSELAEENQKKYGKVYGTYFGFRPILNIADAELVKQIQIKDFNKFVDHQKIITNHPTIDRALNLVEGDDWRMMRQVISPAFSSSKMRKMHQLVEGCVDDLEACLRKAAENKTEVQLKQLAGNYTMQVIASCAFATRVNAYDDPQNPFIINVRRVFEMFPVRGLIIMVMSSLPLLKFIKMPIIDPKIMDFFKSVTKEIIERRRNNNTEHHDLLQLLVEAQQKGEIKTENDGREEKESHHGQGQETDWGQIKKGFKFTETDVMANAFISFVTGYETTAALLAYLLYKLALNQDVQEKLFEEIKANVNEKGTVDYDTVSSLPYLDACVSETLRLYNPGLEYTRVASEDCELGDTNIVIRKGQTVNIMMHGVHHNPEYFPEPHKFDPTRFLPENRSKIVPCSYIPFGAGPRNCVGLRFALMEAKTAIARLINRFRFVKTNNTTDQIKFKKFAILLTAVGELTVGVELR